MAPRQTSKLSALSEEYVVDSSDEEVANPGPTEKHGENRVPETPPRHRKAATVNERPKVLTASNLASIRNTTDDGEGEDEDELEAVDLSKAPSNEEFSGKKSNTSYASLPILRQAGLTTTGLPLGAQ
jgi:hypothetical protein